MGRIIISFDGKVKVLDGIDDQSPMEHRDIVIVATEENYVHKIQIEDGLPDGMATRFTAGVNHLCINKDITCLAACSNEGREFVLNGHKAPVLSVAFDPLSIYLASASCDGTLRIWRIDERKEVKSMNILARCNDPSLAPSICRLSWDKGVGEFLAVPVDKEIRVYERTTWCLSYSLTCPSVNSAFDVCLFSNNSDLIAGGSKDGWIIIWNVSDRNPIHRIRDPSQSAICCLVWHPHYSTSILYSNENGLIASIEVKKEKPLLPGALSLDEMNGIMGCDEDGDTSELLNAAAAQAESSRLLNEDEIQGLIDDDDDDDNDIDLSRIKSDYMPLSDDEQIVVPKEGQQSAAVVATATVKTEKSAVSNKDTFNPMIHKAFQPSAMPVGFRERFMVWNRIGIITQFKSSSDDNDDGEDAEFDQKSKGSIEVEFHDTSLHHSLRLSNTFNYTMADLSMTAILLASKGSSDPSLFDDADEIDSSDLSHIALMPLDTSKASGGDSSTEWTVSLPPGETCEAICLVSDTTVDDNRGYSVVLTSQRLMRIYAQPAPSLSHQRVTLHLPQITKLGLPPISVPGHHIVTVASHPIKPILGLVTCGFAGDLQWRLFYLGGIVLGDNQSRIPTFFSSSFCTWQSLPISPSLNPSLDDRDHAAVRLRWFGFSDVGNLFVHDSTGVVQRLVHGRQLGNNNSGRGLETYWAPVCNTRAVLKVNNRRTDHYFIVGVVESTSVVADNDDGPKESEGLGFVQAIYCKGSKWPRVFPRPLVSGVALQLPLCAMDTDQGSLEENYLRSLINSDWPSWGPDPRQSSSTTNADDEDMLNAVESLNAKCLTKRKAILLRLFALAAKLDSDWASLSIAQLMPDAATVQLAIRYAGRLRRQNLAHRLAGVALEKERRLQMDGRDEEIDSGSGADDEDAAIDYRQRRSNYSNPQYSSDVTAVDSRTRCRSIQKSGESFNASIVSSGTDDTVEDEHNLSGLPLPDSESMMSQSVLSNTQNSSVLQRNPFRNSNSTNFKQKPDVTLRSRGSEVFDDWIPKKTESSDKKPSVLTNKAKKQPKKSVNGVLPKNKGLKNNQELVTNTQEFLDWFEENRNELEENNPEMSVEELMQLGRKEFYNSQPIYDSINTDYSVDDTKENVSNKRLPADEASQTNSKKRHTEFNERASKRLTNFAFESQ